MIEISRGSPSDRLMDEIYIGSHLFINATTSILNNGYEKEKEIIQVANKIIDYLKINKEASIMDLIKDLNISVNLATKAIKYLKEQGKIIEEIY